MNNNVRSSFINILDQIIDLTNQYDKCKNKINQISLMKNELVKINNNQSDDDINFYKCMLNDALFFIAKSLDSRLKKFIYDYYNQLQLINVCRNQNVPINDINKNYFISKFDEYLKINNNNNIYNWMKDNNKILNDWISTFSKNVEYHRYIFKILNKIIRYNELFFITKKEGVNNLDNLIGVFDKIIDDSNHPDYF